ncbi:hypothetical protein L596_012295 [Steinernema carpocapsae]|uniref:Exonuclease domain-containing protein n=1 Tax=Steinernema carpocapsae TaxID=34508 RepID=A0A4U5NXF4_STECR|nr:hypothetical protein L596_012295 [Steinernema carpocapsae]
MASTDRDLFHQMETFIFMDFETTGLIDDNSQDPLRARPVAGDKNRDTDRILRGLIQTTPLKAYPYITEMSFVSAPRSLLLNGIDRMKELQSSSSSKVRLACNIHTRQINPPLNEDQWKEYEDLRRRVPAMKLSRMELEEKASFKDEWVGVLHMLQMTKKPACLVAHNGIRFDFRVLYAELARNGLLTSDAVIPEQIYCLDSYMTFMDLEKYFHMQCKSAVEMMDWSLIRTASQAPKREEPSSSQAGEATNSRDQTPPPEETAPPPSEDRLTRSEPPGARRALFQAQLSSESPFKYMKTTQWSPAKRKRLTGARELFVKKQNGDWEFDDFASTKYFRTKGVFRLEKIYEHLMGNTFDSHYSQDDCEALLQISIAYGREFVEYADTCCRLLPF